MPVRVMTYNIRDGGGPDRLPAVVEVIRAERPDVLALQELRGFDAARLGWVAGAVGMAGYLARSWSGQPVALLVREPRAVLRERRVRGPFHHAAAELTLATDRGPWRIVGAHLCPYSGSRRLAEARWLARELDPAALVLVMGDLNTLDPWTDHGERLRALPPRYRIRHLRHGRVDTRAVGTLAGAGLVDLFRHVGGHGHTAPTTRGGGPEFARMRLDYLLGTAPLAATVTDCRVVSGGPAEYASDHYPVRADLDLTVTVE